MSNMSYCRFENTVRDMEDCIENLDNTSDLSDSESEAREQFIKYCVEVALDYGHEVDKEVEEV